MDGGLIGRSVLAGMDSMPPFFILLSLVLASVVVVSLILAKFRLSLLVGYFLCGLILKNSGLLTLAGADSLDGIRILSDVGIVLLLFTLGIEFSIKELKTLRRPAFLGGTVQMGATTALGTLVAVGFGLPSNLAFVIGFAMAMSSTAVSLKSFQDMGIPEAPAGRVTLGIALFQDLAVIVFVVLLPAILGSKGDGGIAVLGGALAKGAVFVIAMIFVSRIGVPQIMDAVARTRSRELFTLTVVGLCIIIAMISGLMGLSPALGAFAAGLIVSESIYSHRVLSEILPFKDLFLTVFFVSIGLLIDFQVVLDNWMTVVLGSLLLILTKGLVVAFAGRLSGLRRGDWLVSAAALASSGEFSMVLLTSIASSGLLAVELVQILMAITALTMAMVPSLMKLNLSLARHLKTKHKGGSAPLTNEALGIIGEFNDLSDHVVLCGYGPVGRNLHHNLEKIGIRVVVIELNPETVKSLLKDGTLCLFADATHPEALELAKIHNARALAFSFPQETIIRETSRIARSLNPNITIHARVKFSPEATRLRQFGIKHIFHDEEQSGLAMINSVFECYARTSQSTNPTQAKWHP